MTSTHTGNATAETPSNRLSVSLWITQTLLALTFAGGGIWKLLTPIPQLAKMIPWAGEVSPALLYTTAFFDLLGGLGLLLPSVTRIRPGLTVVAALACLALQLSAIVFHFSRSETADTPFNFLLVALLLFVAWGRHSKAPIPPRRQSPSVEVQGRRST